MNVQQSILSFFKKYPAKRVLLGLSGGPDSLALLHLLLAVQNRFSLQIGIAHIDHGWRAESGKEALYVENLAKKYGLPFFLHKIDATQLKGNLENESRKERLAFFRKVCKEETYDATLLAHHSDDLAETVLKRCFEGAGIFSLYGMEERLTWDKMTILRPLLKVSKKSLVDYLHQNHIEYFTDPTNLDSQFLRGRMRQEILPQLSEQFGKNIQVPLCNLSNSSRELRDYMQHRIKAANLLIETSDFGLHVDVTSLEHEVEIKWFLSTFFKERDMTLSQEQLAIAAECLLKKKANCQLNATILLDRGTLFYLDNKKNCNRSWKLKFETYKRGDTERLGWKFAFSGQCRAVLPCCDYALGVLKQEFKPYLNRLWTQCKVPAFLRAVVPILLDGKGNLALEFLSGRKHVKSAPKEGVVTVSLYRE